MSSIRFLNRDTRCFQLISVREGERRRPRKNDRCNHRLQLHCQTRTRAVKSWTVLPPPTRSLSWLTPRCIPVFVATFLSLFLSLSSSFASLDSPAALARRIPVCRDRAFSTGRTTVAFHDSKKYLILCIPNVHSTARQLSVRISPKIPGKIEREGEIKT